MLNWVHDQGCMITQLLPEDQVSWLLTQLLLDARELA